MNFEFPIGIVVIWLGFVIFILAAMWKVYEKAGQPGWAAIIPIYNLCIMIKTSGKPGYWVLLCLVSFLNMVI